MYVVAVNFQIRSGKVAAFMPLILAQARNSLKIEPGCHVFDVCQSAASPEEIFLYEVYDDRAAFDAHLASKHYRRFDTDVAGLVLEKHVRFFERR